jgi:hypothetical protein
MTTQQNDTLTADDARVASLARRLDRICEGLRDTLAMLQVVVDQEARDTSAMLAAVAVVDRKAVS